jgi:HPt (histidine-containing phosphotransfer) domain-containing protein
MSTTEQLLHFDKNAVPALLGDSREFVESVLEMVVGEVQRAITAIQQHTATQNLPLISAEAHKLYGTALTAGLPALGELSQQLELMKEWDAEKIAALVPQLQGEAQTAITEINAFLAQSKQSGGL